ncbi:hypothetical protein VTN49DRAFT_6727 [Thermomyces lanuginosus]|uniref:uncharacterized protein n=1 Tax=Thermomyces lanuginosus TaxID=5541 RepID=UPI003743F570
MKIVDPQSATLTNAEVLAFFTANPPRRPPNPPPNARNWAPKPDLRDHNTVVKEIHNYVERISPHLLNYPPSTTTTAPRRDSSQQQLQPQQQQPYSLPSEPTPLDNAIRRLISELKPFGLTKAEVLMLINLGVGVKNKKKDDVRMQEGEAGGEGEGEEEDDYEARAVFESVVEDREERLSDEDVGRVLRIMAEVLGGQ